MLKQCNGLIQQLIVYILIISLLLQSCNGTINCHASLVKAQSDNTTLLTGKQTGDKKIKNIKLPHRESAPQELVQSQIVEKEEYIHSGLLTSQQTRYAYIGNKNGKRKRIKYANQEGLQKKNKKRNKCKTEKKQRARPTEKKQELQELNIYYDLEIGQKAHKSIITTKNFSFKTKDKPKKAAKYLQLDNPNIPKTLAKTKSKDTFAADNMPKKEDQSLELDSPGSPNKEVKKQKNCMYGKAMGELNLLDFPAELIEEILSYLSFKEAMIIRQLNHGFYEFITGYNRVGVTGVCKENKPDRPISNAPWAFKHAIDFNKLTNKLVSIPSFIFYQFIKTGKNLPKAYWPYIVDTQLHKVNLWECNIGPSEGRLLGEYLQKSKIRKIWLNYNKLGTAGAKAFLKRLKPSVVKTVSLSSNQIKNKGLGKFAKHINIKNLDLSDNQITGKGATKFAKNLLNSPLHELNLSGNKLRDEGLVNLINNLHNKSVTILHLSCNKITDIGGMEAAEKLKETSLEALSLGANQLTDKGAVEIIKGCIGSKMKKLDLSFNRGITDTGVLEIADHIKGTHIKEIDLRQYKPITVETQKLSKLQCPYINWIFG